MTTLALTGATGFVGKAAVEHALARGIHVRALTRREQPARDGVSWIAGDLEHEEALARLASGADAVIHIAGVVNPPSAKKYQHWTNAALPQTLAEWQAGAVEHPGSWWPHWAEWLHDKSGGWVSARNPSKGRLTPIEPAPGSYVKVKS